jgi:hypothetical protein
MSIIRCNGGLSLALRSCQSRRVLPITRSPSIIAIPRRTFHAAPSLWGLKSQILKDVGEGTFEMLRYPLYIHRGYSYLLIPTPQGSRKSRSSSGMSRKEPTSRSGSLYVNINQIKQSTTSVTSIPMRSLYARLTEPDYLEIRRHC